MESINAQMLDTIMQPVTVGVTIRGHSHVRLGVGKILWLSHGFTAPLPLSPLVAEAVGGGVHIMAVMLCFKA